MIKFVSPLIVVEDMARARHFYEDCLGQQVQFDFGEDVQFAGGFSIHQRAHFQGLLGEAGRFPVTPKSNDGELYFEAVDLDAAQAQLAQAGVEFIHAIYEHPWGQRAMRVYDPDGHILEIGEAMDQSVRRLHQQGLSVEQIMQKTGMPQAFVEGALG